MNNNINASFDFADADLGFLSSFPNFHLSLEDAAIVNNEPFKGDTLFGAKSIEIDLGVMQFITGSDDPISLKRVNIDQPLVQIKTDSLGNANYDIAIPSTEEETTAENQAEEESAFKLDLKEFTITDGKFVYHDAESQMHLVINEMNHSASGDLGLSQSELQTHTQALVSFAMENSYYLHKNPVVLDAGIGIDLDESKYTFEEQSYHQSIGSRV